MVVDRVHRVPRILGPDEKGLMQESGPHGPARIAVGGVVLNHLGWAALLGLRVGVFGRQGDDDGGRFLRAAMDDAGMARDIEVVDEASSLAEIFVDDGGARAIYMARGATAGTTGEHVRRRHADFVRRARIVTTEVSQLPLDAALSAHEIARSAGAQAWLDLDIPVTDALATLGDEATLGRLLRGATLLKPSKAALPDLLDHRGGAPLDLARAVREHHGNDVVVVTAGEEGCALCSADVAEAFPAVAVCVVDTTGAGDAFLGGLLAGAIRGWSWDATARLANACGAACCEQIGAFPEDRERASARIGELFGPLPGSAGR